MPERSSYTRTQTHTHTHPSFVLVASLLGTSTVHAPITNTSHRMTPPPTPHPPCDSPGLPTFRYLHTLGDVFSEVVEALSEVGKREEECRLVEDETEKMLSRRGGADYLQVKTGQQKKSGLCLKCSFLYYMRLGPRHFFFFSSGRFILFFDRGAPY